MVKIMEQSPECHEERNSGIFIVKLKQLSQRMSQFFFIPEKVIYFCSVFTAPLVLPSEIGDTIVLHYRLKL